MNTHKSIFISFFLLLSFAGILRAQTPSDAVMMRQWEVCIALLYEHSSFEEYWEGTNLRTNGTIATVNRRMVAPMIAIGIFDRLNLLVGVPFVQTESSEPNGGYFAGAEGFQDLSLALKGQILDKQLGRGRLAFLTTAAYGTPVSNYLADYRPYSIGNGTGEFTLRGILEYKLDNGLYARGAVAHLWRGQTKAERDYYYNNGSYYTAYMDVPSAWNFHAVAGVWMFDNSLRLEASYQGLRSTSGDDIRPYNAPQPTNRVHFDQLGAFAQYYFKKPGGLGLLGYYAYTIGGRNAGKSSHLGAGITYVFRAGKQE